MKNYDSAVSLLRECALSVHGMGLLRRKLGVSVEAGWQQRCLGKVADMVEAELADMERRNAELEEKVGRMAETDSRWEAMRRDLENAIAERDELKARVAELVEKLGNFDGETYCGGTIVDWYEMAVRLQAQVDEMNETHMKLPVDADGIPICVGDEIECGDDVFTVCAVAPGRVHAWKHEPHRERTTVDYAPSQCRHVKPDTVESVLDELLEEARCVFHEDGSCEMGVTYERRADYAKRIRRACNG